MSKIRTAIGATTIDPKLLTCAEKLRYQGYLRRQAAMPQLRLLSATVCRSRRSSAARDIVAIWFRQISRGGGTDMFRNRQSALDGHLPFLDAQWSGGCRNGAELWRRLRGQAFKGTAARGGGMGHATAMCRDLSAVNNCRRSPPPGR